MARIVFVIEILFFCLGLSVSFLQGGNFSKILEAKKKLLKNGSNTNESSSGNLSRNTLTEGDIDFKNPVVVRENLPTVFTSQHARENTEKIQLLNHDRVIKSTFVPIVSEGMTVRRHNKSKSFNTNNNQINPKKILAYHENLK